MKHSFRPEFLNRLDEIVFYKPLTRENIFGILDLQVEDLNRRLSDKRIAVSLSQKAKDAIVSEGYDPLYGARPLKRLLQRKVETLIGRMIIADEIPDGSRVTVDYDGQKYTVSR